MQASVLSIENSIYRYSETKPKAARNKSRLKKMKFLAHTRDDLTDIHEGQEFGQAIASGMNLAKELGNLPGNFCTPTYLAEQAKTLAKGNRKIRVTVVEEAQMKKIRHGGIAFGF